MKTITGQELRKRLLSTYPKVGTMADLEAELNETKARLHDNQLIADAAYDRADKAEAENKRLRGALKLVSERLLAFVSAVGDTTDCSADVDALAVADAALGSGVLQFQNAWGSDEQEGP